MKRGVKVRILVEGDETDAMPVKYASRQTYDGLLSMGIAIYEYQPTMMHTKSLVVDGVVSMFGSANFDNRSLELNDELNIAVANRDLAARLTQRSRRGPHARQAAPPRRVAPALAPREDARALLELFRGDFLGDWGLGTREWAVGAIDAVRVRHGRVASPSCAPMDCRQRHRHPGVATSSAGSRVPSPESR